MYSLTYILDGGQELAERGQLGRREQVAQRRPGGLQQQHMQYRKTK